MKHSGTWLVVISEFIFGIMSIIGVIAGIGAFAKGDVVLGIGIAVGGIIVSFVASLPIRALGEIVTALHAIWENTAETLNILQNIDDK
jgi:uncharacterized sodium:solute symporter family permease YidK